MKTLAQICERNDYRHLSGILKNRVNDICSLTAKKMDEIEITKLPLTDNLEIKAISYNDGSKIIALVKQGCEKEYFIADTNCLWDGYSQYNALYTWFYEEYGLYELTTELRLAILNNVQAIISGLDANEDERVEILRAALGEK